MTNLNETLPKGVSKSIFTGPIGKKLESIAAEQGNQFVNIPQPMKPKIAKWLHKSRATKDPVTYGKLRCKLYDHLFNNRSKSMLDYKLDFFRGI